MKQHPWNPIGGRTCRPRSKKARRKSVAAILKEAYQQNVRDALTRRAVRAILH